MSIRTMIVDDEELARAIVREHLNGWEDIEIVAECANGFEAVKAATELKPDLVFLDIQMPKLDGFEVLELLDGKPGVIFVTAYDQHALRAFEANAVDYLLKPFSKERFDAALLKAKNSIGQKLASSMAPSLQEAARVGRSLDRVIVKDGPKVTLIPLDKLDFVQAQDDYVLLKTEGRSLLKQQTMASLESQLDSSRFIRIHRSYILNLERLARLEQDGKEHREAVLRDGTRLPVSKTGYQRLRELWEER
jgi:two-component system, LytTR family, response regulator